MVLIVLAGVLRDRQLGPATGAGGSDVRGRAPSRDLPEAPSTRAPRREPVVDDEMADIEELLKKRGIERATTRPPSATASGAGSARPWRPTPSRCPPRSPWSTSTRSTPTPTTSPAARVARRSGWPRSRCECRDLVARALAYYGFSGVLAYTVAEALHLHATGISDDVVVAYPSVDRAPWPG